MAVLQHPLSALVRADPVQVDLPGAKVSYVHSWLSADDADRALALLTSELSYSQHRVRLFGREMPAPRLSAWIGDPGMRYRYSGVRHEPMPWTPILSVLREKLQQQLGCCFNSVLVNRYRDGRDSMGWHADDEAELGLAPLIASISLGATRTLRFRARAPASFRGSVDLHHGSLLLMAGDTQARYQHAIHKTRASVGERINLTFRQIDSEPVSIRHSI